MDVSGQFNKTFSTKRTRERLKKKTLKCDVIVDRAYRKNTACGRIATEHRVWADVPLHFCAECAEEWDTVMTAALNMTEGRSSHAISLKGPAAVIPRKARIKKARQKMGQGNKRQQEGIQGITRKDKKEEDKSKSHKEKEAHKEKVI